MVRKIQFNLFGDKFVSINADGNLFLHSFDLSADYAAIYQLRNNPRHDYISFFVCRNPVDHLISTYGHYQDKILTNPQRYESKFWSGFYSWDDFLQLIVTKDDKVTLKTDQLIKRVIII